MLANTVVALSDESLVNFVYHVDGLDDFDAEYQRALKIDWQGNKVTVLPLPRIIKSKTAVGRPKDLAHLPLLRQTLRAARIAGA